ncbi:MAG: cupin domain-containing protein [Peptococcaceae bacterium]|nr:cupin domain-containing protein [Peptococcaceae bacterium]
MIIRENEQERVNQENYAGGNGVIEFKAIVPDECLKGEAKIFKVLTFEKGAGIGNHAHVDNYEIYYILQGKGIAVDNGEEIEVGPGDVVYTADGATHSIRDAGNGDLVMLAAVIFENKAE